MFSYPEASRILRIFREFPNDVLNIRSLSIDTRTLVPGDLFVALKGEKGDGHQFLAAAFEKGASGAMIDIRQKDAVIVEMKRAKIDIQNLLSVDHPQNAMTELAALYRKTLPVRVVGITGSVGKTTTKEFLFFLLKQKYSALATAGNLNNHLGVPIMLSRLKPEHQFCVLEMGASHAGEVRYLANLARPSAVVLTPIGPAHLEGFGSLENVYKTKLELADACMPEDPLVIPDSDEYLQGILRQRHKEFITVGTSTKAAYRIEGVDVRKGEVFFSINGKWHFSFPGQASFLVLNAGLAIAMARSLGISWEQIPSQWQNVGFASGRFRETILPNGVHVVDDSYNANPVSFENALKAFQTMPATGKKILVFADMLELGKQGDCLHWELGEKIAASGIGYALAYGEKTLLSIHAVEKAKVSCIARHFRTPEEIVPFLKNILRPGDSVLFKGSRGMRVERILADVQEIVFDVKK